MKKFFIGLGIFFVLAGIVFCAADTKDTSARAQALYDAPVVTMQDLEEWKNQNTQQEVGLADASYLGDNRLYRRKKDSQDAWELLTDGGSGSS